MGELSSPIRSSPCGYTQSLFNRNQHKGRFGWETAHRQSRSCSSSLVGLTKAQDRLWERPLDRAVSWRGTRVSVVREARQKSCRHRDALDGFDPSSTLIRANAPPFLSHPGGVTDSAGGRKQQGRDQCDAKDVKESRPGTRNKERNHGSQGTALTLSKGAFVV